MDGPRIRRPPGGSLSAYAFAVLTAAFGVAVLIQIFFAGEAALIAPEDWEKHLAWIHFSSGAALHCRLRPTRPHVALALRRSTAFPSLSSVCSIF